jgi:hypothetical protein
MKREDIEFDMYYSYYLESMFGTLMNRLDKAFSIFLIASGTTVFAQFGSLVTFGAAIAIISTLQFVIQPGNQAATSIEHSKKYIQLISKSSQLPDNELLDEFIEIQSSDSNCWSILKNSAFKNASLTLNRELEDDFKMSLWEGLIVKLSGGNLVGRAKKTYPAET